MSAQYPCTRQQPAYSWTSNQKATPVHRKSVLSPVSSIGFSQERKMAVMFMAFLGTGRHYGYLWSLLYAETKGSFLALAFFSQNNINPGRNANFLESTIASMKTIRALGDEVMDQDTIIPILIYVFAQHATSKLLTHFATYYFLLATSSLVLLLRRGSHAESGRRSTAK